MNKQTFLTQLRKGLSSLSKKEREEHVSFYSEMLDDRIEEGVSEEDAVAQIGEVNTIVAQILDNRTRKNLTDKPKRKYTAWTIVLLALGSPIWLALLISAFAVAVSLYVSLWAVIISLWAVFVSTIVGAIAGILLFFAYLLLGNTPLALTLLCAALVCAGVSILFYYACKAASVAAIKLTQTAVAHVKQRLLKKENVL